MITDFIKKAFKSKSLIGVRTIELSWGESIIGFVSEIFDDQFIVNEIDEYGEFTNNTTIPYCNIVNMDFEDRYQKRLLLLVNYKSYLDTENPITISHIDSSIENHFNLLIEQNILATFFLDEDDYVTGILLKFNDTNILIQSIGNEGDDDGLSIYQRKKIVSLRYNSKEELRMSILYNHRLDLY